jgi:outer membrane protein OmpA-like peptidoglycan-associated protein
MKLAALAILCALTSVASAQVNPITPPGRRYVTVTSTDCGMYILEPVYFTGASTSIPRSAYPTLDLVAEALIKNPSILLVEVQGHTDDYGSEADNLALSDVRAAVVRNYLITKGVEPRRLEAQGYGETQPESTERTPEAGARNRRATFLILKRATD